MSQPPSAKSQPSSTNQHRDLKHQHTDAENHNHGPGHWFEAMADHMGQAYLRYSFTKGTEQEVAFLTEALGLVAGERVLDVGCGPGRHSHALGQRGMEVLGVDISARFVELANQVAAPGVSFQRLDARELPFNEEFDAVISLCQGAFGLQGDTSSNADQAAADANPVDPDFPVLAGMVRALRPGGRIAFSAFSAYFQVRYLDDQDSFNAATGVNHETTAIRSEDGRDVEVDLWTSCFTPRELRLMVQAVGLVDVKIFGVTPGAYGTNPPGLDHPEFLVIATKPA